jgi:alanyl-tRNA synthetase
MGALLRELLKEFAAKGGGGKDFVQGTLADPSQVRAFLERAKAAAGAKE